MISLYIFILVELYLTRLQSTYATVFNTRMIKEFSNDNHQVSNYAMVHILFFIKLYQINNIHPLKFSVVVTDFDKNIKK